jgi:hypothetical protein
VRGNKVVVKKQNVPKNRALKALKELARMQADMQHFEVFTEQIRSEENDRGAAILAATNVEIALRYALARRLTVKTDQDERIFGLGAPLSTFDNKIRIAYALEIFGDQTKTNLDIVREIRNAFAHAHIPITFKTDQVKNACKLLIVQELLPPRAVKLGEGGKILAQKVPETDRDHFIIVCEGLAHNLLIYGSRCFQTHRTVTQDDRYEVRVRPKPLA